MWPDGYAKIVLEDTDSTMAEVRRRVADLAGPTWIMAKHQTAATGRRGRAWKAPAGNFAATLYLPLDEPPQQAALRTFVASLALHDALGRSIDPSRLSLKWPNDVLLNGGKVAGILLESSGVPGAMTGLSIGIGVNLVDAPPAEEVEAGAFQPVALHGQGGPRVDQEQFLTQLAAAYAEREQNFRALGFEPTRRLWLSLAARIGEVITARIGSAEHVGTFETVDEAGNLVLATSRGRMAIPAGDVFF